LPLSLAVTLAPSAWLLFTIRRPLALQSYLVEVEIVINDLGLNETARPARSKISNV
jgi:hypothetical protein